MLMATAAMARGPSDVAFSDLDADGNGEISAEEFATYKSNAIAAIDTNGDGFLSMEELAAMRAEGEADRAAKRFEKMVERIDADGDELISLEEFASMGGKRGGSDGGLPRGLDADESGGVSEEEFAAAQEKMAERGERGGKGKRGGKNGEGHGDKKASEGASE